MSKEKLVRKVEDFANAMSEMKVANAPEIELEPTTQITNAQKHSSNIKRLEPKWKVPTGGKKHPEMEKQREYLTEYVEGVFENKILDGQGIEFWLTGLPGDDYCMWSIPPNKPISIPRFVAQKLSKGLRWREMKPLAANQEPKAYDPSEMNRPFEEFIVKKRGTFQPLDAY